MAHWPKTVSGNLFMFALVVMIAPLVVWIAVALSGPLVWASLAVVALLSLALYAWRRRVESARERAWVGQFSFGDVVRRMRAREALDLSHGLEGVL
jgi:membrane protein implicated in regulation of membrane protease activity